MAVILKTVIKNRQHWNSTILHRLHRSNLDTR